MVESEEFLKNLQSNGIDFFTGVPDSLLKDFCAFVTDHIPSNHNIIAANEGGAISLAAGYHLATRGVGLVYLQNSGLGNLINPLLSLIDREVYGIPVLLLIGWRGEPGKKDEPQHIQQGKKTIPLLDALNVPYSIMNEKTEHTRDIVGEAAEQIKKRSGPFAIVASEGTFSPYKLKKESITKFELNREQAIQLIVDQLAPDDIIVSTTGKASRELFEYRENKKQGHSKDFLTVGSMGHSSQIALGISLAKSDRKVYCLDGDGAAIMHLGSLAIVGTSEARNFKHIIINNGSHDSVGGQPTVGFQVDFTRIALACGYAKVFSVSSKQEFFGIFNEFQSSPGPVLLEIKVNKGARNDLGRPTSTPMENKNEFMINLTA